MTELGDMTEDEFRASVVELVERGLLTCTRGRPGEDDATYALAWLPLDNPETFSKEVRERHAENMKAWGRHRERESNLSGRQP